MKPRLADSKGMFPDNRYIYDKYFNMVQEKIEYCLNQFKTLLASPDYDERYKWEALKNFQDNWDIEAIDFYEMYNQSLQCDSGDNLWASQFFYPKQTMLDFIKLDTEKVRSMFKELFDEEIDIEKRIDHFVYHCDQLSLELQKENPNAKNHFHDGYRIISLYLAFRYPTKYTIYKYTEFKAFMEFVRAKSIPGTKEIARFFKVMNLIYTNYISKDSSLLAHHKALIEDEKYYHGETILLAQDLYWCTRYYL